VNLQTRGIRSSSGTLPPTKSGRSTPGGGGGSGSGSGSSGGNGDLEVSKSGIHISRKEASMVTGILGYNRGE